MDDYTRGPWKGADDNGGCVYSAGGDKYVGYLEDFSKEDIRRIIACVNACEGFITSELEDGGIEKLYVRHRESARVAAREHITKLTKHRERLLSAIKGLLDPENDTDKSYEVAYDAIAEVEKDA